MTAPRNRLVYLVPLAAVQIVSILCGIIGVRWSSAVVPPAAMGVYGLLLSAQQLASAVTHQGFIKHVQQHWSPRTAAGPYVRLLANASGWPLIWLAAALAVVVGYFTWSIGLPKPVAWWGWLIAVNLLAVVSAAAQSALQAEERYWAGFGAAAVGAATRSFLPPLCVVLGASALPMLGTGFLLHGLLFAAFAVWCLRAAWRRHDASQSVADIASPHAIVKSFMGVGFFGWLAAAAPRWFAAETLTPEATGYFILATNLAMIVPASAGLIGQNYSFPVLFGAARDGAGERQLWRITARALAGVMLGAQAGLLLLTWCAPYLIGLIIDVRYANSVGWILAAGGAVLATLSGTLFCNLLIAAGRQAACVSLSAASAGLRLAILIALTIHGDVGAFRIGLFVLPWPTLALEGWLTCRILRKPARR